MVRLGKTNLQVSRVAFGGIPLQRPSESEAIKVIQHAINLGVNLIDTSIAYGESEIRIGKAIAGRREKVMIATKGIWRDKKTAQYHIDSSLKRLNTNYIDIWQLHGVNTLAGYDNVVSTGGALEAAQESLKAGKIRHIGMSSHSLQVSQKAIASDLFEVIQYPFNFVNNEAAEKLVPLAREYDVGFIAMKPFNGGMMKNANLCIKYLLQFDNVVPDPGIEKTEEIDEIVGIVNSNDWKLTPTDWKRMDKIRAELGDGFCRLCGYCQPCPNGVDLFWLTIVKINYNVWPRQNFLDMHRKPVESAVNCIQCGECEEKCPYQLPIREIVAEGVRLYEQVASQ
jgi:predicted aldo/keto reductase-like oxidoreductase